MASHDTLSSRWTRDLNWRFRVEVSRKRERRRIRTYVRTYVTEGSVRETRDRCGFTRGNGLHGGFSIACSNIVTNSTRPLGFHRVLSSPTPSFESSYARSQRVIRSLRASSRNIEENCGQSCPRTPHRPRDNLIRFCFYVFNRYVYIYIYIFST